MLVSHKYKFIFVKTKKSASTTVEDYFTRFCVPHAYKSTHAHDELITEHGIVGRRIRGKYVSKQRFNVKTTLAQIKKHLGNDKFNEYRKFTVIRNPFDRALSLFYFTKNIEAANRELLGHRLHCEFLKKHSDMDDISLFRKWITKLSPDAFSDKKAYLINNKPAIDFYIKYENLIDSIQECCEYLGVPFYPDEVGNFKNHYREAKIYKDFYTQSEINIIKKACKFECETFGYDI
tara:strand:+ start:148 stop:849 length:702 start_codon:yes stop_codon:yes gene_type:complete